MPVHESYIDINSWANQCSLFPVSQYSDQSARLCQTKICVCIPVTKGNYFRPGQSKEGDTKVAFVLKLTPPKSLMSSIAQD